MQNINIKDFQYELPDEKIAKYPLEKRDSSRLLHWENGVISNKVFSQLPELLSGQETLFFNNTKVIPARLYLLNPTNATIEVFLLSPLEPKLVELAMKETKSLVYHCTVGNLKKWNDEVILERIIQANENDRTKLTLELIDRKNMHVRFSWDNPNWTFAKIIEYSGETPIPPYLNRKSETLDKENYQTVYSKKEGAVAAPTAGLHFTEEVLADLLKNGNKLEELTLHVSAGTFRPVKTENAIDHDMHSEQIVVKKNNIESLLDSKKIIAVGTTSMRTLESIFWYGAMLLEDKNAKFEINKNTPYSFKNIPSKEKSFEAVLNFMNGNGLREIYGDTQIYLYPGYDFKVCDGLITNFHQPGSTLMLLVAAFTGGDHWKNIYSHALENDYRFLSYGDSSLIWRG
jgi:S-adenosylmethionine:tRNA ribosyltransferase-isomerase